ncbi:MULTISPECIES: hypothetical protein [unclassified Bradyrhizobium]|uniref:methylation-associated defense system protein MAD7 n=1 Tax=unclassified Bradyrhizobium TaxID=2631580 RepID=UPI003390C417
MKLRKQDQEFRNPKVFYPDPKNVDLDRVLINLFLLLRCDGTRPATRGRAKAEFEQVRAHVETLAAMPGVTGVLENKEIAQQWLETDIFDLVNRNRPTEAIASLRPLHLDAHKIRVSKYCRDYNHADALYAMLEHGDRQALVDLRKYLERGRDPATGRFDGATHLDLETLTVLKLVEDLPNMHPSGEKVASFAPVCVGQSRILGDDVQRLLAYQDVIPRPVMIDYLKAIFGLHIGLFTLRVGRQLSGWVKDRAPNTKCQSCPVQGAAAEPFQDCPYQLSFTVDMGSDFRTRMAQLAQQDAASEYSGLIHLVKSIFSVNQLLRYAQEEKLGTSPAEVVALLTDPPDGFEADFKAQLKELRRLNEDNEEMPLEVQSILDAGLPPFDTFIEIVSHIRQKHHMTYLVQMLDKLFQKNSSFGALIQGRSKANPRRWHLGGRLLEVFVQLAVLRADGEGIGRQFSTEPMLIDDFLRWIERRYGFVIGPSTLSGRKPTTLDEHRAFRENLRALKDRLREIGFYDDLSDAYNAQTVKPRYILTQHDLAND